ncbi:YcaO-like family protein [Borreliella lusitaniae]|uniref:YcaO-like family protein n=1 Tax=Borreliella lusitaniae TaxID=100177 RepID=UPI003AB6040E
MFNYYPYSSKLYRDLVFTNSPATGIGPSLVTLLPFQKGLPLLYSSTCILPSYHKILIGETCNMEYHISGYGRSYEEAITRLQGETIERYSLLMSKTLFQEDFILSSRRDLLNTSKYKVMPLEYRNVFSNLDRNCNLPYSKVCESDEIYWILLPSLIHSNEKIWVPCDMVFMGIHQNFKMPTFSTGTAVHRTVEIALCNAIIEVIQLHCYISNWYIKSKRPVIDWKSNKFLRQSISDLELESNFDLIVLDYSDKDLGMPVYAAFLRNKKKSIPYLVCGIQGGFNKEHVLLRAVEEAAVIAQSLPLIYFFKAKEISKLTLNSLRNSFNLDDNFFYYSNLNEISLKDSLLNSIIDNETRLEISSQESLVENELDMSLNILQSVSKYAVYCDITPPELESTSFRAIRILVPELLKMCFPFHPFDEHPYFKKKGEILDGYFPHPIP